MLTSTKLRRSWYKKVNFLKLQTCVYSRTKFRGSNIILTSFRRGNFTQILSNLIKSYRHCNLVFVKVLTKQCLICTIEKWLKYRDTAGHCSTLLTDLCKTFDCVDHQLLIFKTKCIWSRCKFFVIFSI